MRNAYAITTSWMLLQCIGEVHQQISTGALRHGARENLRGERWSQDRFAKLEAALPGVQRHLRQWQPGSGHRIWRWAGRKQRKLWHQSEFQELWNAKASCYSINRMTDFLSMRNEICNADFPEGGKRFASVIHDCNYYNCDTFALHKKPPGTSGTSHSAASSSGGADAAGIEEMDRQKRQLWRSQMLHSQLLHEFVMHKWQKWKEGPCASCMTDLAQILSLFGRLRICHAKQLDGVDGQGNFAWQTIVTVENVTNRWEHHSRFPEVWKNSLPSPSSKRRWERWITCEKSGKIPCYELQKQRTSMNCITNLLSMRNGICHADLPWEQDL